MAAKSQGVPLTPIAILAAALVGLWILRRGPVSAGGSSYIDNAMSTVGSALAHVQSETPPMTSSGTSSDSGLPGTTGSLNPTTTPPATYSAASGGMTNWSAASYDAAFVARKSMGDTVGADTNPAPGAAAGMGFSGVVGSGTGGNVLYSTFLNGVLVGTSATNPGANGFSTPFGLASGNLDAQYTGPGAVRP